MTKPNNFMLLGGILSLLIFFSGLGWDTYQSHKLASLEHECRLSIPSKLGSTDDKTARALTNPAEIAYLDAQIGIKPPLPIMPRDSITAWGCDPVTFPVNVSWLNPLQKEILKTYTPLPSGNDPLYFVIICLVIFALFSIPFAWYFLLRRIRELSDAFRGR